MDKRTKKRIAVLRERLQKLQKILAGARQQHDEPGEIQDIEQQIAKTKQELETLTGA